jgi:hypothetical protein
LQGVLHCYPPKARGDESDGAVGLARVPYTEQDRHTGVPRGRHDYPELIFDPISDPVGRRTLSSIKPRLRAPDVEGDRLGLARQAGLYDPYSGAVSDSYPRDEQAYVGKVNRVLGFHQRHPP